jgi:2-keto-4-pentenoate hydratase/2-oxohepta-3-ene-1,7-dioic acid hydratase in catechol pathway
MYLQVLDLSLVLQKHKVEPNMQALIESYTKVSHALKEQAAMLDTSNLSTGSHVLDLSFCRILSPLPQPRRNVICVGKNYADHVREVAKGPNPTGSRTAAEQLASKYATFFTKAPDSVIGPEDTIPNHASITKHLDYEVELAVIIGKEGRDIASSAAMQHVMGTICFIYPPPLST